MKRLSIIFTLLAISVAMNAQPSIKVQAPNVVASDEQFNISFIIEGEESPSDFSWDAGENFQIVWGPQKGQSTSVTIINGKRTKSSQYTYTYVLLPKKTGTFSISEATAKVGKETVASRHKSIEVVSGNQSSQNNQSSGNGSTSGSSSSQSAATGEIPREDLFLRFTLSKTNVVVGEPLTATLKLYQRVNIAGFEDAKFPTFNGFWSQEVLAPTNIDFERESYNNAIYNTAVLRSWMLIPQQAGDIAIDPAELVCLVNVRVSSGHSNSIFDSFFQDDYRTIRKRVVSDAYKVHVSKLPSGAPESFGGGVGTFSMSASLSRDSLKTHDAASLFITVSGKGNVSLLEAPKVNFPPDFEVYDVKVSESTDKSGGRTSGSKTFEYPFIPRSHGKFEIGQVEYSYYDIKTSKYVTLNSGPITVNVARGNDSEAFQGGQVISGTIRKDVKSLGSDIRFISSKMPGLSRNGDFFVLSGLFWILLFVLTASACAAYFLLKKNAERRADVVGNRNRAATKMAQKRLSLANGYLSNNLYTAFYEELHKALLGFVSDKLNMDVADLSKENIASSLAGNGVAEGLVSEFTNLLDACEFARYAPDSGHDAMRAHYETAVNVISLIDSCMKKKSSSSHAAVATAITLLLAVPFGASAAPQEEILWQNAVEAYSAGNWEEAIEGWNSICAEGLEAPELYYNLGNAYFKNSDYSHAILNYERALKLDPSYSDARFNLEFANEFIQDKIDTVPEFFLKTWTRKAGYLMSSNSWAAVFFILLALALAGCILFFLSSQTEKRRLGFFGGIVAFVLSIVCLSFSISQKSDYRRADSAIVIAPVTSVKSSPGSQSAKDLFILHEGTKVRLMDSVGGWYNVELSDGRQGWIESSDFEII